MDRRLKLRPDEKVLLEKLRRGTWRLDELAWLERHLRPDAPTVLLAEVRQQLQALRAPGSESPDDCSAEHIKFGKSELDFGSSP
jgi:hypothetical protein